MARRYTLRQRAERVDETRRRITEAAVELHRTLGPAKTTVSAIAARAGVQRLTVYRHFPDERALFAACSAHWLAAHPPPDPAAWMTGTDPAARLRAALEQVYAYYERTAPMWERVLRDAPGVPAVQEPVSRWLEFLDGARDVLAGGWRARGRRRELVRVAIRHAIDFTTWATLTRHGAGRDAAVALMAGMVTGSAAEEPRRPRRR